MSYIEHSKTRVIASILHLLGGLSLGRDVHLVLSRQNPKGNHAVICDLGNVFCEVALDSLLLVLAVLMSRYQRFSHSVSS